MRSSAFQAPRYGANCGAGMIELPRPGEHVRFEAADSPELSGPTTVRISTVEPSGFGMVTVIGEVIGAGNQPSGTISLRIPVVTLDARRVHR